MMETLVLKEGMLLVMTCSCGRVCKSGHKDPSAKTWNVSGGTRQVRSFRRWYVAVTTLQQSLSRCTFGNLRFMSFNAQEEPTREHIRPVSNLTTSTPASSQVSSPASPQDPQ